ncbi:hypothetical protein [Nonomuraea jabiensis]|uniref:hypothetical protein n=1 Tax=Nonomuraea jabiensis TaxID=882448 RepID=UPI003D737B1E
MSAGHGQPSFTCQLAVSDLLASARRILVADLAEFCHERGVQENGIAFGYGHLDTVTLRRALHALTGTLDDHRLPRRSAA